MKVHGDIVKEVDLHKHGDDDGDDVLCVVVDTLDHSQICREDADGTLGTKVLGGDVKRSVYYLHTCIQRLLGSSTP